MRKLGRTTRLIDQCIQSLFNDGSVQCIDHHIGESYSDRNIGHKYLFYKTLDRLKFEHGMGKTDLKTDLKIDKSKFTIALIRPLKPTKK